jgi:YVTN family beta-propeller protein
MNSTASWIRVWLPVTIAAAVLLINRQLIPASAQAPVRFAGPTSSQPLALSADDALLAVANPDNNTVTVSDAKNNYARLAEVAVGKEPNGVAISPDGSRSYVANTVDGTVSVLGIDRNSNYVTLLRTISVGTEPYGLALTPTGRKLYVANARSNSVSVIETASNYSVATIANAGLEPRGIAITNSGSGDDTQETVFVTRFLSLPVAGKVDGSDDATAGHVTAISAATDTVIGDIVINPIADTGSKAAGDALQRIAPPATPVDADFKFVTGAYPNQLNNIALRGKFAFVPNTGASPNGPVRFNVNTQSLLSVIDTTVRKDAGKTINMHAAVNAQTNPAKRFITQAWAIAFKHTADEGYVISAASNIAVMVKIDPVTGAPAVQSDPTDATRVLEIPTGKNPRGIVINSNDQTAYVMNYVSRDVAVIDLSGSVERVATTLKSADLPAAGTLADKIQVGKDSLVRNLFHLAKAASFSDPAISIHQPVAANREIGLFLKWSVEEAGPAFVSEGLISDFQLGLRLNSMQMAAEDRDVLALAPRMSQVWARKEIQ